MDALTFSFSIGFTVFVPLLLGSSSSEADESGPQMLNVKDFLDKPISMYVYVYLLIVIGRYSIEDQSTRRQCSTRRRRISGRIYFTAMVLPASPQNQGKNRLHDDGVDRLVAELREAKEEVRRIIQARKDSMP